MTAEPWRVADAVRLYNVDRWGGGYFGVNAAGNVAVKPRGAEGPALDLKELVEDLRTRGVEAPMLLRFGDILESRVAEIHAAFRAAIEGQGYGGGYHCLYPVKVNQQRHVIEDYLRVAAPLGFGLEAGSKPELLAVLALSAEHPEMPIVCNGFKDEDFIRLVVLAQKLGKTVIPIVERYAELDLVLRAADEHGVKAPLIGARVKLATRGSGRWGSSTGARSKFGLVASELLDMLETLKARGMASSLQLLHFHLGSQISNIRTIKAALVEATRIYAELARRGAGMRWLDVGGGLGVDYDGSQSDFESSINYSLREYAADVVHHVKSVCEEAGVPHPTLFSESGRALMAHHSVLVFEVIGAATLCKETELGPRRDGAPRPIADLRGALECLTPANALEAYHDATRAMEEIQASFALGHVDLEARAEAERVYRLLCSRLVALTAAMDYVPEELQELATGASELFFANFSVFQSLPDSWAVDQLFPIMPLHRLGERPGRRGVLVDLTCDSDGKVAQYIDLRDVKPSLELHAPDGRPYYVAAFLVGAYQETLGDLHNLFGDTNAVHVRLDAAGRVQIDEIVDGDTVREVLGYVQFAPEELVSKVRREVDRAVREARITPEQARVFLQRYEGGLAGYTYLTGDGAPQA